MTPHIANVDLWKTSGHFDFYADGMFDQMDVEKEQWRAASAGGPSLGARRSCRFVLVPRRAPRDRPDASPKPRYQLKPMNCPFHCLVYKDQLRSYRDLPFVAARQ